MELLTDKLIRPHRSLYSPSDLGPSDFRIHGVISRRDDFTLRNSRGLQLMCSWYYPIHNEAVPCLIYCHGNCGSRLDAREVMETMVPLGISVFALDFAGSGLSEGDYVSLGYFEKEDIRTVVEFLRMQRRVQTISLWGRSMGAAAAILYASTDRDITFLVLDSPFTSLAELIKEQTNRLKWVPTALSSSLMRKVKQLIYKTAHFDIDQVSPLLSISKFWAPCAFIHAPDDSLISINHSLRLFSLCPSKIKSLHKVTGGHNSPRSICLIELMARKVHDYSGTAPFYRPERPLAKRSLLTLVRTNRVLEEINLSPRTGATTARSILTSFDREKTFS